MAMRFLWLGLVAAVAGFFIPNGEGGVVTIPGAMIAFVALLTILSKRYGWERDR